MSRAPTITQAPEDVQDYDLDFSDWFPPDDVVTTATVTVTPTTTPPLMAAYAVAHPRVKVFLRDGVSGADYTLTVLASTSDGRAKEICRKVRIRDC